MQKEHKSLIWRENKFGKNPPSSSLQSDQREFIQLRDRAIEQLSSQSRQFAEYLDKYTDSKEKVVEANRRCINLIGAFKSLTFRFERDSETKKILKLAESLNPPQKKPKQSEKLAGPHKFPEKQYPEGHEIYFV